MVWSSDQTPAEKRTAAELLRARSDALKRARVKAEFYTSDAWLRVRYGALKRFDGACHCCGCRPSRSPLHVDHIKPRSKYPELELEPSNVQVLCVDCNFGKSNRDETDWRWK